VIDGGSSAGALAAQTIARTAGTGAFGYSGDGGPATSATLSQAFNLARDRWKRIGKLPKGLKLQTKTGFIAGTPRSPGTSSFTVQLRDKAKPKHTTTRAYSITVL
jgi:hypothetical protein